MRHQIRLYTNIERKCVPSDRRSYFWHGIELHLLVPDLIRIR